MGFYRIKYDSITLNNIIKQLNKMKDVSIQCNFTTSYNLPFLDNSSKK
jgi:hypothetical protein